MSTATSSGELREVKLIQQAAGGDGDAFGLLFEKHFQTIYNYVLWLCNDPDQAEDLTQETFIRAHRSLGQLGPPWRIKPWLYRLAHNLFIDFARQKKEHQQLDPDAPFPSSEGNPEREIMFEELSGPVHAALVKLSPNYREALVLREVQGFHYTDIAEIMGVSVDHVKVLLHRARTAFKDNYGLRLLMEKPMPQCTVLNELLDAYRDRELTSEQEEMVRQHVKDCPTCKQRKRELAALLILFRGQPIFKLPQDLHHRLLKTPNQPGGPGQGQGSSAPTVMAKGMGKGAGKGQGWAQPRTIVALSVLGGGIILAGVLAFIFIGQQPLSVESKKLSITPTIVIVNPPGQPGATASPTQICGPGTLNRPDCPTPTATLIPAAGGPAEGPTTVPEVTEAVASQCFCEVVNNAWDGNWVCATADGVTVSTMVDTAKCPPPVCGNGKVEGNEQCDGRGCTGGAVCNADCTCGPAVTCTCVVPRGASAGVCAEDRTRRCTPSTTP